jgi:N-acetylglutamate synthase-like GNAT family acetyltransferase
LAEITIRPARRADSAAIRALIFAVHINPTGLDWRRFLVAVDADGSLLGCGQVKPHGDGSRELASIAVQERVRGRGLARVLIEALVKREKQRPLYLMCRAHLQPLYAKFGFRPTGIEDMSPYFRRISRIERLLNSRSLPEDGLLIMRLD